MAAAREIEGQTKYPTMHGDQGWYGWSVSPWLHGAREIHYLTWDAADRDRLGLPDSDWLASFANYSDDDAATALAADFTAVRSRVESFRNDPTTPDTRLSDEPMIRNPATVATLCRQMWGGLPPNRRSELLLARLRYFDPVARRPGLPADVAALVGRLTDDETDVTLVNISQTQQRSLIVQGGGYGEHECVAVVNGGRTYDVRAPAFRVSLAPGCGATLTIRMHRHHHAPRLTTPWD